MHVCRGLACAGAVMASLLALSSGSLAQAPVPTPTPRPPVETFPFRFVVSGPSSAQPGSQVTYRVQYERTNMKSVANVPAFVFNWPGQAASFVSSRVVAGPEGAMAPPMRDSVRWDYSQPVQSGAVEVILRIVPVFTGSLIVGIDVLGTGLVLPEGSVDAFTTDVAAGPAPVQLPSTGTGPPVAAPPLGLAFLLALSGATALAGGAGLWFARRR
jgi:hypothetical protein